MGNRMRGSARNCMWLGLLLLVMSAMAHLNPLESVFEEWSHSGSMCLLFCACFLMVATAWWKTRTIDFATYSWFCAGLALVTGIEASLIESSYPSGKLTGFIILCAPIVFVPYTVLAFRGPLLMLVK